MTWQCPRCREELGELNGWCEYCKQENGILVYNPDKYYIRDIRVNHIISGAKTMTPQEELFSELFNHEKILVKNMDTLTLRAHRETLAKIAFEARARLTAVDSEDNDRRKKRTDDGKPTGFERSLNTDETTTNAINAIKGRQTRVSKAERIKEGLEKLYKMAGVVNPEAEATKAMSAKNMLSEVNKAQNTDKTNLKEATGPKAFNPFEKKS